MSVDSTEKPKPWNRHCVHCLDFEGSRRSGIVEYGLVTLFESEVVAVETRLCRAQGPITEIESATHNIRQKDVATLEGIEGSWELFRDRRSEGPFAAHHAGVENGLIKSVWPFVTECTNFMTGGLDIDWGPWLDTCALYRALFPGLDSYNLANLIQTFDLTTRLELWADRFCPPTRNTFHCAPFDALASAVLLQQLEAYEELKSLSLAQLLQWSQPGKEDSFDENQLELL